MTTLASIRTNHLSLECPCGHQELIPVSYLLETLDGQTDVTTVVKNARCSLCKSKGLATFRIVFVGGSFVAMEGARQKG